MDHQLIALYQRHVAPAFDRQLRFNEFLERKAPGADWEYDSETATLSFGKLKFEAPVVGSHAGAIAAAILNEDARHDGGWTLGRLCAEIAHRGHQAVPGVGVEPAQAGERVVGKLALAADHGEGGLEAGVHPGQQRAVVGREVGQAATHAAAVVAELAVARDAAGGEPLDESAGST